MSYDALSPEREAFWLALFVSYPLPERALP